MKKAGFLIVSGTCEWRLWRAYAGMFGTIAIKTPHLLNL
jgi:hypothetical protein